MFLCLSLTQDDPGVATVMIARDFNFLRPEEHKDYVDELGVGGYMFKPPSVIIKEAF